jgi:hypothetical protein
MLHLAGLLTIGFTNNAESCDAGAQHGEKVAGIGRLNFEF